MVKTCLIKQVFCNIFSFIELIRWLVQSSFLAAHGWPDFLVYQINCQLTWIFNKEWVAFPWVMNSCEAFFSLKQFGTLCWNCSGQRPAKSDASGNGNTNKRICAFVNRIKLKILLCDANVNNCREVATLLRGCSYQSIISIVVASSLIWIFLLYFNTSSLWFICRSLVLHYWKEILFSYYWRFCFFAGWVSTSSITIAWWLKELGFV